MSSTLRSLPSSDWTVYFDRASARISESAPPVSASVGVLTNDVREEVVTDRLPLLGITYDDGDDVLEVQMDGLDHMVSHPLVIQVSEDRVGLASIRVTLRDGTVQEIDLR